MKARILTKIIFNVILNVNNSNILNSAHSLIAKLEGIILEIYGLSSISIDLR